MSPKQQWQIATLQQGNYGISHKGSLGLCTLLNRNVKNYIIPVCTFCLSTYGSV